MTKAFLTFATLALFCFTSSLAQAQNNGVVSVAVTNTSFVNGQSDSQSEFVEFDYEAVEWNNEAGNLESEWSYEEAGVGEFELTNQAGDVILIKARNDDTNQDLGAILGTVVGSSALGGFNTVADNIGNSVSANQERLQNANTNGVASTVVSNAENVANNAGAVIGTVAQGAQNASENAAQAVENAGQQAQNVYNNATSYAENAYNQTANQVNNLQENASEVANSAANTVSNGAENAVNSASNAAENVANSATESYNNAVNSASNAAENAANSATESYNNAVNSVQNRVESVQNGLSSVGNAYNQGFLSRSNQQ